MRAFLGQSCQRVSLTQPLSPLAVEGGTHDMVSTNVRPAEIETAIQAEPGQCGSQLEAEWEGLRQAADAVTFSVSMML